MEIRAVQSYFFTGTPLTTQQNGQQVREADLIARLCKADENALEVLYHIYYPRLFRFVARIAHREDFIDEVINDVMFVVWEKASTYDPKYKPSTWIFGIAFNKTRQAVRDSDRSEEESLDELDEDSSWLGRLDSSLSQMEFDEWLEAALAKLTPEHRAVIELTFFEGLHYSEVAEIMNCPENTVKTRMHHARKNLALLLNETDNSPARTH